MTTFKYPTVETYKPGTIGFIEEDPVTKAMRESQDFDAKQAAARANLEGKNLDNEYSRGSMSPRLRALEAGATTAEVGAEYARPNAEVGLRTGRAGATTAETTAEYSRPNAQANLRKNNAGADQAEIETGVKRDEAPYAGPRAKAGLRQLEATATTSELAPFHAAVQHGLKTGDWQSAKTIAAKGGMDIPDSLINDSEMRSALADAYSVADKEYRDRPKDYDEYIKATIKYHAEKKAEGNRWSPEMAHGAPGAPTPQVESRTRAGEHVPAEITTAEWLKSRGIAKTDQEAWDMVRAARTNPVQTRTQVYNNALRANGGDAAEAERVTIRAMEFIQNGGVATPAPAAPAPAPVAAAPSKPWYERLNPFGGAAPAPQPATTAALPPAPAPQRPEMMTPGNGNKPQDIKLPPNPPGVPPGSAYSPSRQMWKAPDGKIYDASGRLVGAG